MRTAAGPIAADVAAHADADALVTELRARALAVTGVLAVIRLATWLVFSLLFTAGVAWLVSLPGTLTLEVLGLSHAAAAGHGRAARRRGPGRGHRLVVDHSPRPQRTRLFRPPCRESRRDAGTAALSDGFIALQAGDPGRARVLAARSAQQSAAQPRRPSCSRHAPISRWATCNRRASIIGALINDKKTAVAALAGLYEQARTQGRTEAASVLRTEGRRARPANRLGRRRRARGPDPSRPLGTCAGTRRRPRPP